MTKKSIADAIKAKVEPPAEKPVTTEAEAPEAKAKTTKKQSSRAGQKHIGGYYPPECLKALKLIAVEDEITLEDVIATAMNQFLSSRGKAPIFPVKSDAG
ncbi:ribbon-helix-helix domain-containing protein [Leptothoe spongobia]|uniref:Antitoxin-like ribbon-helix-helix domain-containing protein n=1 Tax=Leptothoe spongobia TAU-MAC 1115 TaxID=1967444 RepID=A0A947DMF1_9CYAN|nr:ribbon-helix-helix domain-containing protein [Leptothoe spongobia]MBT9317736.1 hypothetical protein [Leptothoe spongobia TAU-MAC 1115]